METINHECYVSLEVAKLLKQAGFDWKCAYGYDAKGSTCFSPYTGRYIPWNDGTTLCCSKPSLEVAQRWLREVKGHDVFVVPCNGLYVYTVRKYYHESKVDFFDYPNNDAFPTYEEAQGAGIKKALELILEKGE